MQRHSSLSPDLDSNFKFIALPSADWLLIFAFASLRLLISFKLGLGVDEAHYALYGIHLDWSYFDHPPLVGWINGLFLHLFGVHDWVFRLPANICGIVSSYLLFQLVWMIAQNKKAAIWSVVALNVAFLPVGLFIMFLPDTLLLPLSLWLVLITARLVREPQKLNLWLQLAVCIGLCGLTKYTSVLFVLSLIGIAFSEKVWRSWLSWRLVVAMLIAAVLVLPVLYWNHLHDWISFAYQSGHVVGQAHFEVKTFITSLLAQLIAYSPFLVALSVVGLFLPKKFQFHSRIALWFALPCFIFFAYSGFTNFVLPHWTFVVYVLFLAVAIAENLQSNLFKRFFKFSVFVTLAIALVLQLELLLQVIPFPDYQSPYTDLTGWTELRRDLVDYKQQHPEEIFSVGIPNWSLGSRAVYYFAGVADVFVLDERKDQFDLWEAGKKPADNVMLLSWHDFKFEKPIEQMCRSHEKISERIFKGRSYTITGADWILCRGFQGLAKP